MAHKIRFQAVAIKLLCLLVFNMSTLVSAVAVECEKYTASNLSKSLKRSDLKTSLQKYLIKRVNSAPFMSGDHKNGCSKIKSDLQLYPNIPYRDCIYEDSGLVGWSRVVVMSAPMIAEWVTNACATSKSPFGCTVAVTAHAWCDNNLSFPIAANIIEPASSGGGKGSVGTNFIFAHGVTIARPKGIPEQTSISAAKQKAILEPFSQLAEVPHNAKEISRPSGIRREIYLTYGRPVSDSGGKALEVGASCPESARKNGWLEISRRALVDAWNQPHHALFDAAARAFDDGADVGKVKCD